LNQIFVAVLGGIHSREAEQLWPLVERSAKFCDDVTEGRIRSVRENAKHVKGAMLEEREIYMWKRRMWKIRMNRKRRGALHGEDGGFKLHLIIADCLVHPVRKPSEA